MLMQRREFCQLSGAAALALASPGLADLPRSFPALDAHTHFYDPTRPQGVPWPGKGDRRLYRPVLPPEFKDLTRKHHVRSTIVVEASPWLEDNQWLLDLARNEPFIVGIVGRLDPATAEFAKHWERFAANPLYRGIRINHKEVQQAIERKPFLANLQLLAKHDRALDANGGPDMPADVARLARALPGLRIVINHAANVTVDGRRPPETWLKGMRAAAQHKQVYCKVSALVEGTRRKPGDVPTAVDFYRPVLDALWDLFGADRLVFGSNWPVSDNAASFAVVHEIVRAYFSSRGAEAAAKFFLGNARAAYKPIDRPAN